MKYLDVTPALEELKIVEVVTAPESTEEDIKLLIQQIDDAHDQIYQVTAMSDVVEQSLSGETPQGISESTTDLVRSALERFQTKFELDLSKFSSEEFTSVSRQVKKTRLVQEGLSETLLKIYDFVLELFRKLGAAMSNIFSLQAIRRRMMKKKLHDLNEKTQQQKSQAKTNIVVAKSAQAIIERRESKNDLIDTSSVLKNQVASDKRPDTFLDARMARIFRNKNGLIDASDVGHVFSEYVKIHDRMCVLIFSTMSNVGAEIQRCFEGVMRHHVDEAAIADAQRSLVFDKHDVTWATNAKHIKQNSVDHIEVPFPLGYKSAYLPTKDCTAINQYHADFRESSDVGNRYDGNITFGYLNADQIESLLKEVSVFMSNSYLRSEDESKRMLGEMTRIHQLMVNERDNMNSGFNKRALSELSKAASWYKKLVSGLVVPMLEFDFTVVESLLNWQERSSDYAYTQG
jgi:hypothetical protein